MNLKETIPKKKKNMWIGETTAILSVNKYETKAIQNYKDHWDVKTHTIGIDICRTFDIFFLTKKKLINYIIT